VPCASDTTEMGQTIVDLLIHALWHRRRYEKRFL
jgi:hypothetical protein